MCTCDRHAHQFVMGHHDDRDSPVVRRRWNRASTTSVDRLSRLPVGSSAKIPMARWPVPGRPPPLALAARELRSRRCARSGVRRRPEGRGTPARSHGEGRAEHRDLHIVQGRESGSRLWNWKTRPTSWRLKRLRRGAAPARRSPRDAPDSVRPTRRAGRGVWIPTPDGPVTATNSPAATVMSTRQGLHRPSA